MYIYFSLSFSFFLSTSFVFSRTIQLLTTTSTYSLPSFFITLDRSRKYFWNFSLLRQPSFSFFRPCSEQFRINISRRRCFPSATSKGVLGFTESTKDFLPPLEVEAHRRFRRRESEFRTASRIRPRFQASSRVATFFLPLLSISLVTYSIALFCHRMPN